MISASAQSGYSAYCPHTEVTWQLPRTRAAESIAKRLMEQLSSTSPPTGRLYGVLLAHTISGKPCTLHAYSGSLATAGEWVPPLTVSAQMSVLETEVLQKLNELKTKLIALDQLPVHQCYQRLAQQHAEQRHQLALTHQQRKQNRDRRRCQYQNTLEKGALSKALDRLKRESQQDSRERCRLKQLHKQTLAPLSQDIDRVQQQQRNLKQTYTALSKQWQTQMQRVYTAEMTDKYPGLILKDVVSDLQCSISASLLERAATKLLYHAAINQLSPIAMAEFWWGPPQGGYSPGQFYGASSAECQTLMRVAQIAPPSKSWIDRKLDIDARGDAARKKPSDRSGNRSGYVSNSRSQKPPVILYQDESLIVVDKPAGLLSVPGRRYQQQDSVLNRLRYQLSNDALQVVHRLDQATSGLLVLAVSPTAHKQLSQQFAQRQVGKRYEAILSQPIEIASGTISLPLWSNPQERPKQSVSAAHGRASITHFQSVHAGEHPRVQFIPQTGRTHQLRVHAAHPQGLNSPILGDGLYGGSTPTERLYLHAASLEFVHPRTHQPLCFASDVPF